MASIFDELFLGQKELPEFRPLDINQALVQGAAGALAGERAYAPGFFDLQLQLERAYDPNIAALRAARSRDVLGELNLGGALSPEIQQLITQNLLQSGAASGFGLSRAGRGLVARDLGLTSLELARQRRNEAGGVIQSSPTLNQLYSGRYDPSAISEAFLGQQQEKRQAEDERFFLEKSNRLAPYTKAAELLGTTAGAVLGGVYGGGNVVGGAQAGREIAGAFVSNPYAARTGGGGGGGGLGGYGNIFGSLLAQYGNQIGGPRYGIGAGQQYITPTGQVATSVRAAPVANPYG